MSDIITWLGFEGHSIARQNITQSRFLFKEYKLVFPAVCDETENSRAGASFSDGAQRLEISLFVTVSGKILVCIPIITWHHSTNSLKSVLCVCVCVWERERERERERAVSTNALFRQNYSTQVVALMLSVFLSGFSRVSGLETTQKRQDTERQ